VIASFTTSALEEESSPFTGTLNDDLPAYRLNDPTVVIWRISAHLSSSHD